MTNPPTAAQIGNTTKIAEIVEAGQKTSYFAEELGISSQEMAQLKEAGKLRSTITSKYEHISKNPVANESFKLLEKAQEFLKSHKQFMTEAQCRELIHKTGIPTFPRPRGVPENFRIKISDKGAGMIYIHPEHTHTSIRVMPRKPHRSFPYQQKPYVIYRKNGKTLDKFGNAVDSASPEAHIPLTAFVFKD